MSLKKILEFRQAHPSRSMGPNVKQVIPSAIDNIDPFVFLDHFSVTKFPGSGGIPAHPHAGIATITYLFEGSNRHRDSLGNDQVVKAGDLAWMQAGSGIVHSEGMDEVRDQPENVKGLQLWISLPAKDKFIAPSFYHYPSDTLPVAAINEKVTIKILCGEYGGLKSPVKSLSPAYIFDVAMQSNSDATIQIQQEDNCGIYVTEGIIQIDGYEIGPGNIVKLDMVNESVKIHSENQSRFIILGGKPLHEPIVAYASYVMNTEEQIIEVMNNYQKGKFGNI